MKIDKKNLAFVGFLAVIVLYINAFYYSPALNVAKFSGTVLSDNWWSSLNWIKNNTAQCSVVATYWDPGHFITGIAKRSVVFDGATQGATVTVEDDGRNITRSRIQDIATTLFTDNETLAIGILKAYRKPGCDGFYYIASSDLISKSQWWTYFATWDPTGGKNCPFISSDKGYCYVYSTVSLGRAAPLPSQNAIVYTYPLNQRTAFVIYEINGTPTPYFQQDNQLRTVENIFYFTNDGAKIRTTPEADLQGLIWLDPSKQIMVFIPPELANSLFTRMFFFNGFGLERFEFVDSWGGEVKIFKVNLE